jgi:uncharacterized protein YecE (DUF72 family)
MPCPGTAFANARTAFHHGRPQTRQPQSAEMQAGLFDDPAAASSPAAASARPLAAVWPLQRDAALLALRQRLDSRFGPRWHLGTSSWHFPGWHGLVWDGARPVPDTSVLSRQGLAAYAQHPLLRCVSLDRTFYRAMSADSYAGLAAQAIGAQTDAASAHAECRFRFVVKVLSQVTDAQRRDPGTGASRGTNPAFLDPDLAMDLAVHPAVSGLGQSLGVLVFQLSPLPMAMLAQPQALFARLQRLWLKVLPALPPGAVAALEVRDSELLTPALAQHLKGNGVRYCLGLHDRMPCAEEQLPMLRALWPGDLVCRWNLQRGQRYAQARDRWAPFDRLQAPDEATRRVLARVSQATLNAGHRVFVTINNKAEGCAPRSVLALAQTLADLP